MRALVAALMLSAGAAVAEAPLVSPRPEARLPEMPAVRPIARPVSVDPAPQQLRAEWLMSVVSSRAAPVRPARAASLPLEPAPVASARQFTPDDLIPGAISLRPMARPVIPPIVLHGPRARAEALMPEMSALAVPVSLRPAQRTAAVLATARRIEEERARGAVCGDRDIQGVRLGVHGGPGACGVEDAVRVRAVDGIRLTTPAVMDCATARALKTWVERGLRPAVGTEGGGPEAIRVMAHYSCRPRNNQPGARLSEHAFGRAIDIGGIRLRDGSEISVLRGWNTGDDGARLQQMWQAACGAFGTVLGPNANAQHRDHFHFDTARYRSGSYCR